MATAPNPPGSPKGPGSAPNAAPGVKPAAATAKPAAAPVKPAAAAPKPAAPAVKPVSTVKPAVSAPEAKPASAVRPAAIPPPGAKPGSSAQPAQPQQVKTVSGVRPAPIPPTPAAGAKQGSGVKPAGAPAKPASAVRPASSAPSGSSGRRPAANVTENRQALGLGAMKPSEMVAGLDEAAKRAEKLEQREEEKRRSGGRLNANVALHTDDTGKRWKRTTNLVLIAAFVIVAGGIATLVYLANHKPVNPREINAEARQMLSQLVVIAGRIKPPFGPGDTITADAAKQRIIDVMDVELKNYDEQIEKDRERIKKTNSKEAQRSMIRKDREALARLRELKDGLNQPFVFEMADADTLKISAKGSNAEGATPPDPVTVKLRKAEK